jgi:hypothetical protein
MSGPDDDLRRVRTELRDAAQGYEPDRAAIASRIAAGRSAARKRDRLRPAGAALAVVAVLIASVVAVRVAGDADRPDPPPVIAAPSVPASPAPSTGPSSPAPAAPSLSASRTADTPSFVSADGSIDKNSVPTWTQNTVTLENTEAVTGFEVAITVAGAGAAKDAGRYTTVPNADLTVSVDRRGDDLVYRYVLNEGIRLAPGTWLFAAQFTHGPGRSRTGDSFTVTAWAGGTQARTSGDFA